MKKHLFRLLAMAFAVMLSIPIARAADISPIWYANNATSPTSNTGLLNNSSQIYWWNGAIHYTNKDGKSVPDSKINPSAMAVIGEHLYITLGGGGSESTSVTLKNVEAKSGGSLTSHPLKGWSGGTYPLCYMFSLGGKLFATNFAGKNSVKIYEIPVAKIGNGVNNLKDLTATLVATLQNPIEFGEVVGASGDLTNGRVAFMNPQADASTIYYVTVTNGTFNTTVKSISLTNADGTAYKITDANRSRAMVKFLDDGSFIVDNNGIKPVHFTQTGIFKSELTAVPNVYGNAFDISTYKDQTFISVVNGQGRDYDHSIHVYNITDGLKNAELVATCKTSFPNAISETTHFKQHISGQVSGNTLKLWIMQPCRGVAYFNVTLPEPKQAAATDLKVSQVWNGDHQEATFTWTPGTSVDHYTLRRADKPDYTESTPIKDNIAAATTSFKYTPVQLGLGYQPLYILTSYAADGKVIGVSAYARQWDLGFGSISLKSKLEDKVATLTWNAPANGTVTGYTLKRIATVTDANGTTTTTVEDFATLAKDATSYTINNFEGTVSGADGSQTSYAFYLEATMAQKNTPDLLHIGINTVTSNQVAPAIDGKPVITRVATYDGRTTATLEWEISGLSENTGVSYYDIYRDNALIKASYEAAKYTDMNLPNGTHSYYVVAHLSDGKVMNSNTVSCKIERNRLVTGYGLEEVYNYPIAPATQEGDNYVKTTGAFANGRMGMNSGGAPGDIYRQAQFYNGKWYLACVTTQTRKTPANQNKSIEYITYYSEDNDKDATGGYYVINADDPRDISKWQYNSSWKPLENQSIAVSEDGVVYWKSSDATSVPVGKDNWYLSPIKYVKSSNSKTINLTSQNWVQIGTNLDTKDDQQHYRTHYISFAGNSSSGRVLAAMNKSSIVYAIGTDGTVKEYKAFKDIPEPSANGSTENYAFPVVGRNGDFLHLVRSEGFYYVNATTGEYTKVYSKPTDIQNPGGVTFIYNNETFLVHPTAIRSNNVGHFSIDMADSKNQTLKPEEASFENMIPVAAFSQPVLAGFEAGNSNANWFGTQYDATDDCMYIYQYVPGVRFAKYKFYKYINFPGVTPTLDIKVKEVKKANGNGVEVDFLNADVNWKRPDNEIDGYKPDETNTEYLIGRYDVRFLDQKSQIITGSHHGNFQGWDQENGKVGPGKTPVDAPSDTKYNRNFGDHKDNRNLTEGSYSVEVTPIYYKRSNHDVEVRGEGGIAIARAIYPANIGPLTAKSYYDPIDKWYRVELDFDRAPFAEYPWHVSYFTLEVSTDGGKTFTELPQYSIKWNHNGKNQTINSTDQWEYINNGTATRVNLIPGDYCFGNGLENGMATRYNVGTYTNDNLVEIEQTGKTNAPMKSIADQPTQDCYKGTAKDGESPCVAYTFTQTDPKTLYYRAAAHYAANNPALHKVVYTAAGSATPSGQTTSVGDIEGDYSDQIQVYPVPAQTVINVNSPCDINSLQIFSFSGAMVHNEAGNGTMHQSIDISNLPAGMYMLKVNDMKPIRFVKK